MMRCEDALLLAQERLDGALASEQAAPLDAHLGACADCAAENSRLHALRAAIRAAPSVSAPAGLHDAVMTRISASPHPAATAAAGGGRILRMEPRLFAGLAAAAVLLVAVGVTLLPPLGGPEREIADLVRLEEMRESAETAAHDSMDDAVSARKARAAAAPEPMDAKEKNAGGGAETWSDSLRKDEKSDGGVADAARQEGEAPAGPGAPPPPATAAPSGAPEQEKGAGSLGASAPEPAAPAAPAEGSGVAGAGAAGMRPGGKSADDGSADDKSGEKDAGARDRRVGDHETKRTADAPTETRRYVVFRTRAEAESFLAVVAAKPDVAPPGANAPPVERAAGAGIADASEPADVVAVRVADLRIRSASRLASVAEAWGGILGPEVMSAPGARGDVDAIAGLRAVRDAESRRAPPAGGAAPGLAGGGGGGAGGAAAKSRAPADRAPAETTREDVPDDLAETVILRIVVAPVPARGPAAQPAPPAEKR